MHSKRAIQGQRGKFGLWNQEKYQGDLRPRVGKGLSWLSLWLSVLFFLSVFPGQVQGIEIQPLAVKVDSFSTANVGGSEAETLLWSRGNAASVDGLLRLVPDASTQAGTVVRRNQVKLTDGFSTFFQFKIHKNDVYSTNYADGLSFIVYDSDTVQLGGTGEGVGYSGIDKSVVVEFDVYPNSGSPVYDPDGNHVAIMLNGNNSHIAQPSGSLSTGANIKGVDVYAWVDYDGETITATFGTSPDRNTGNTTIQRQNVGDFLKTENVFVGFSASTGGAWANHDIIKWYFKDSYVSGGLDASGDHYRQAASLVAIALDQSENPNGATIIIKDALGADLANEPFDLYLDNVLLAGDFDTGEAAQYNFSMPGGIAFGNHSLRAVALGGATHSVNFTVVKASQSIDFPEGQWQNKVYGDDPFFVMATATSGLPVTFSSSDSSVATVDANTGEVNVLVPGTTVISASQVGDETYAAAQTLERTLVVSRKTLTTQVGDYSRLFGEDNPTFEVLVSGFVNGETEETAEGYLAPVASTTATTSSNAGEYSVVAGDGTADHYDFDYTNVGRLQILPRTIAIRADNVSKYKGQEDPELTYVITEGNLLGEDGLSGSLAREAGEATGTYRILQNTLEVNENYQITYTEGIFRIRSRSTSAVEDAGVIVLVNGLEESIGQTQLGSENGRETLVFTVDQQGLERKIQEVLQLGLDQKENTLTFPIKETTAGSIRTRLNGEMIKALEKDDFTLVVDTPNLKLDLPAREIAIDEVARRLGISLQSLKAIDMDIVISQLEPSQTVQRQLAGQEDQLLGPLMEIKVIGRVTSISGEVREVEVKKFSDFVSRTIRLWGRQDSFKGKTGGVLNADGSFSHIPTLIFTRDQASYARLQSLTNSTYAVLKNPVEITHLSGHWSEVAVEDMASRLILGNLESFRPDQAISRGEFATYMVKTLGLYRTDQFFSRNPYWDLSENHPAYKGILIAGEWGLVGGYPDGTFKAEETITREEAMAMYARAMKLASLPGKEARRIEAYQDKGSVSAWAYEAVAETLSAKVFNGRSLMRIEPQGILSHSEAIVALRNLLVQAELINP